MPLNSMTGHGRGEASFRGARAMVELHSVNHRQFDLRLDLPPYLSSLETEIRRIIHTVLARGSVTCRCHIIPGNQIITHQVAIDHDLARKCFQAARQTARRYKAANDLGISALFSIPGVIKVFPVNKDGSQLEQMVVSALRHALKQLGLMRAIEGRALEREIRRRLRWLKIMLDKVARRRPLAARQYKTRIKKLLISAAGSRGDKKVLREIIMLAERGDIAEELERSRVHLQQFNRLLASKGPAGRTMDFLVQEMMREINTIGAKSNDCVISNLVVQYKSELECVREQVQNIE